MGKEKRNRLMTQLGLHYARAFDVTTYISFGISNLTWEPPVYKILRKVLRKGGRVFIDVGAYHGLYSLLAARLLQKERDGRIVALEPDPANFKVLAHETAWYGSLIKALPIALWINDDEQVVFYRGKQSTETSSMSGSIAPTETHRKSGALSGETVKVQTIRLDTLIKQEGFGVVDLVKIDIEGAELHVLTDSTLDLSKVRNLVVEVHYNYLSVESRRILAALRSHGFKVVPLPDKSKTPYHVLATKGEVPW
ncbi:MAG: FkbM family methyltransferase [Candidatus Caldarchaeum sp.]